MTYTIHIPYIHHAYTIHILYIYTIHIPYIYHIYIYDYMYIYIYIYVHTIYMYIPQIDIPFSTTELFFWSAFRRQGKPRSSSLKSWRSASQNSSWKPLKPSSGTPGPAASPGAPQQLMCSDTSGNICIGRIKIDG